jgi:hypothetical protein
MVTCDLCNKELKNELSLKFHKKLFHMVVIEPKEDMCHWSGIHLCKEGRRLDEVARERLKNGTGEDFENALKALEDHRFKCDTMYGL